MTESTKKAARCFYALSQPRADSKRYPAIDPIDSYSKYLEYDEVRSYLNGKIDPHWVDNVYLAKDILLRGREAYEQINILGDDGVPVEYHERYWKSEVIDFVILQQDGFDKVDQSTSIERQHFMLNRVLGVCAASFRFGGFEEVNPYFKRIINTFKQMNYAEFNQDAFRGFNEELDRVLAEREVASAN